jgi:hypothetical protein
MSNAIRSARGDLVNFELLAIKSQLASVPVPKKVEERRVAIEEREGTKPVESPAVNELLKVAEEAAVSSAKAAPKRK